MRASILAIASLAALVPTPAVANDAVLLHAAGSLRGALTEIAVRFEDVTGSKVQAKFGASGLLRDEIASGAKAEVFASANLGHPQALARMKRSSAEATTAHGSFGIGKGGLDSPGEAARYCLGDRR
jgi:molybdate transport system substrate-binding protein